jgi:integrase
LGRTDDQGSLGVFQAASVSLVQELLRHASSRITLDVYQQADNTQKKDTAQLNVWLVSAIDK